MKDFDLEEILNKLEKRIDDARIDDMDELMKLKELVNPFMKMFAMNGDKAAEAQLVMDEVLEMQRTIMSWIVKENDEEKLEKALDFCKQQYLENENFIKEMNLKTEDK